MYGEIKNTFQVMLWLSFNFPVCNANRAYQLYLIIAKIAYSRNQLFLAFIQNNLLMFTVLSPSATGETLRALDLLTHNPDNAATEYVIRFPRYRPAFRYRCKQTNSEILSVFVLSCVLDKLGNFSGIFWKHYLTIILQGV